MTRYLIKSKNVMILFSVDRHLGPYLRVMDNYMYNIALLLIKQMHI